MLALEVMQDLDHAASEDGGGPVQSQDPGTRSLSDIQTYSGYEGDDYQKSQDLSQPARTLAGWRGSQTLVYTAQLKLSCIIVISLSSYPDRLVSLSAK